MSGVPYHAWTHRPKNLGGTDPIEVATAPWIWLRALGQTLPGDGLNDPFLFDELVWDPALVTLNPADVTDGSDTTFGIDILNFGGTDYFQPTLLLWDGVEGWYEFEIEAGIDNTSDGAPGVFWEVDIGQNTSGGASPGTEGATWSKIWNGTDEFLPLMRHQFSIFAFSSRAFFMQSRQNTGANKSLEGWMMIRYLGQLGGGSDNANWEAVTP